jgi:DAACS family dicarboxylate/amino acid:cation (Na+ or H+) symporter
VYTAAMTSHRSMLVGLLVGTALGLTANALAPKAALVKHFTEYVAAPAGQIFLRLLFMLVIPLLFSAIVLGISELEISQLGRLGVRLIGYTVVVSAIAVLIGVGLVQIVGPGRGLGPEVRELAHAAISIKPVSAPTDSSPVALIVNMIPDNVATAAAKGDMLALIVFSLIFGVGVLFTKTEAAQRLKAGLQGLYDVTLKIVEGVLRLAPIGVGALLFTTTARLGFDVLRHIGMYVLVVVLALAIHMFVVYSLSVKLLGGMNPLTFFRSIRLALTTAFSTASSNATLPTALKVANENLGLPRHVSHLVLTAGASMNQNGTALFEGVTVLFLAQVYDIPLTFGQQLVVVLVCILAGIGTAGVPAGSLPVIAMILGIVGVPIEGLGLVIGVDRFLDMCRTTLNVAGDLAAAVYVGKGEREIAAEPSG